MKINLNLASRPYIELRPVYSRLRLIAVVLAVVAVPLLFLVRMEETKASEARARVQQLENNITHLRDTEANARALATRGPNAAILQQAEFLNGLFRRKSFSWTATMADLETTLPNGVEVHAIAPVTSPDGRVLIRMRVMGPRNEAVAVVRNLEHSRHFVAPRLTGEALANQTDEGGPRRVSLVGHGSDDVQFDILADYRPVAENDAAGGSKEKPAVRKRTTRRAAPREPKRPVYRPAYRPNKPVAGTPMPQGGR